MNMNDKSLQDAIALSNSIRSVEEIKADLETPFFPTETYTTFRSSVFSILEARETRLKSGLTQQKGAALLAPAGVGKTRLVKQVISEFEGAA